MLAGSLVNAQLSPAGVICKTEHYLVRKTVSQGPWGHTVEDKFELASPKERWEQEAAGVCQSAFPAHQPQEHMAHN